ncbi:uncharacterized protein LOC132937195 isoform X2 [Metopolophium dirhodum]|uniref:uncharacterized protein LOC132937195 isoform X2 n=1 Tax=Metopolophium dirhodum TaxID=44670 RepID=UPI00298F63BC|nr:uncharacterized protein LOC132937195 isoform X2 [Metopolophium dirhodum]
MVIKKRKKREGSKRKRDCFASKKTYCSSTSNKKTPMLSYKQKLRVVSKAAISASEDDRTGGEVKQRISGQSGSGSRTGLA